MEADYAKAVGGAASADWCRAGVAIREPARRVGPDVTPVHGDVQALLKAGVVDHAVDGDEFWFPYNETLWISSCAPLETSDPIPSYMPRVKSGGHLVCRKHASGTGPVYVRPRFDRRIRKGVGALATE